MGNVRQRAAQRSRSIRGALVLRARIVPVDRALARTVTWVYTTRADPLPAGRSAVRDRRCDRPSPVRDPRGRRQSPPVVGVRVISRDREPVDAHGRLSGRGSRLHNHVVGARSTSCRSTRLRVGVRVVTWRPVRVTVPHLDGGGTHTESSCPVSSSASQPRAQCLARSAPGDGQLASHRCDFQTTARRQAGPAIQVP